jgi:hypothetical protein
MASSADPSPWATSWYCRFLCHKPHSKKAVNNALRYTVRVLSQHALETELEMQAFGSVYKVELTIKNRQ